MTIASFQALRSRPLEALDGKIGDVRGFYFSDEDWKIRYLIAKIRWWFNARFVLVSAYAFERVNSKENTISVRLTKLRIRRATPLEFKKPVSEQQREVRKRLEIMQMSHPPGLPAAKQEFPSAPIGTDDSVAEIAAATGQDPHLRSSEELRRNYMLHAATEKSAASKTSLSTTINGRSAISSFELALGFLADRCWYPLSGSTAYRSNNVEFSSACLVF